MSILKIDILGTSFAIKAREQETYLNKIRDYYATVCRQIEENDELKDQKQIAILAGIMITDELFKAKDKSSKFERDATKTNGDDNVANRITLDMIDKIDQALL